MPERFEIVADLEQVAAGRTAIERVEERMIGGAAGDAAEDGAVGHDASGRRAQISHDDEGEVLDERLVGQVVRDSDL